MPDNDTDILIGKVAGPFGIRGEVKLVPHTDFPERVDAGREVTLKTADGKRVRMLIERSSPNKGGFTVKFRGVQTRGDAETLRDAEVVIDESELAELSENAFYLFDLMGLKVVTDDGREQGEIVEIMQGPANDVYVTSTSLCIPALKNVVVKVDLENRVMTIHPVPGLLD